MKKKKLLYNHEFYLIKNPIKILSQSIFLKEKIVKFDFIKHIWCTLVP